MPVLVHFSVIVHVFLDFPISQYFEMKMSHSRKCAMLQTVEQNPNVSNVFRNA